MARYATLAEVKLYRGIATTKTSGDVLLSALITRAVQAIDRYCDRVFETPTTAAATHYFDAVRDVSDDRKTLYLDDDLCAITTVVNGDGETVATTHYTTEPRHRTPYRAIRLTARADADWTYDDAPEDAIQVSGRWAYATTAPADIKHATIRLTAYMYAQKDASVFDITAFPDSGVMTVPQGMPRDVREILDGYKKLV